VYAHAWGWVEIPPHHARPRTPRDSNESPRPAWNLKPHGVAAASVGGWWIGARRPVSRTTDTTASAVVSACSCISPLCRHHGRTRGRVRGCACGRGVPWLPAGRSSAACSPIRTLFRLALGFEPGRAGGTHPSESMVLVDGRGVGQARARGAAAAAGVATRAPREPGESRSATGGLRALNTESTA
jgi:hypothetical protein